MEGSAVVGGSAVGRQRRTSGLSPGRLAQALASLCPVCGGRLRAGRVLVDAASYRSLECAQVARELAWVPGNYLG